jgi:hypothetical protein
VVQGVGAERYDVFAGYLRIFRLLWAVKHVEAVLEQSWSTINSTQRVLNVIREQERMHGVAVNHAELVSKSTVKLHLMLFCLALTFEMCVEPDC